jgi:ribosomal protein L12E/L44/L45/RPP1/RPP2
LSYQQCIAKALESVGLEADDDRLTKLLTELEGKDLGELLEHGTKRLAKLVAVAVAAVVAAEVLLLVAQLLLKQWKKRKKKRKKPPRLEEVVTCLAAVVAVATTPCKKQKDIRIWGGTMSLISNCRQGCYFSHELCRSRRSIELSSITPIFATDQWILLKELVYLHLMWSMHLISTNSSTNLL